MFLTNRCSEFEVKARDVALGVGSAGTTKGMGLYRHCPLPSGASQFCADRVSCFAVLPLSGEPVENSAGRHSLVCLFLVAGRGMPTPSSVTLSTTAGRETTGRHDRDGHRRRSSSVIGNRATLIKHVARSRPSPRLLSMPGSLFGCAMRKGPGQSRPFGPADRRSSARSRRKRCSHGCKSCLRRLRSAAESLQILTARTPRVCARTSICVWETGSATVRW